MHAAASNLTISQVLVMLTAVGSIAVAAAPVVTGAQARRPMAATAGGVLGLLSVVWLLVAFLTDGSCDGTCGRSAATLYVSGIAGLACCAALAAALARRAPQIVRVSAIVAGAVALGVGAARW